MIRSGIRPPTPQRPCAIPAVAEILECHQGGYCYGRPRWEHRPLTQGEPRKAALIRECPYRDECREWWRRHPEKTGGVQP